MPRIRRKQLHLWTLVAAAIFVFCPAVLKSQDASGTASSSEVARQLKSLLASVNQLQSQMQTLNSQMTELRAAQQQALSEAEQLRAELDRTREQLAGKIAGTTEAYNPAATQPVASSSVSGTANDSPSSSLQQRMSRLEDDQSLMNEKMVEQSQSKVESGSKYRVRLSGIVLLNAGVNTGSVDNLDFPQVATPPGYAGASGGAVYGSLRQSQVGIEAFGPDIAGAHTSGNVKFDFAGGFPNTANGAAFGLVRLRTGTIRMDWSNTSLIAGQDSLFFAPLTPTTLSSLAIPALSYAGNLWSWTPQIRIEHRIALSENSRLAIQAGILDSLTGNVPQLEAYRSPSAGERSEQPAYATHVSYTRRAFGRDFSVGMGGYYGRQHWGFGRNIDGWAGLADLSLPLGNVFSLSGEFYRGRAVGGLGGGIGQTVLLTGPISQSATQIYGLDSMGGWIQLKYKPRANFEVNFAYGQDNPFASELRAFPASELYQGSSLSRNLSPFVNFIYRIRSDVLFSVEYRRLQTYTLDWGGNMANQVGLNLGYAF